MSPKIQNRHMNQAKNRKNSSIASRNDPLSSNIDQPFMTYFAVARFEHQEPGHGGGARRWNQPKIIPSADPDGFGSGRRIIRNELNSPISPARIGISSATCRASGRASVLIRMISAWVCRG